MTQPFIGIDFGTCNSSAAWFNPRTSQAEPLLSAEGENKTPSVVYFGPKNEIVIGRYAEDRLEDPDERKRVLIAVKRNLTKKIAMVIDGRSVTPVEAAALILGKIKRDAEELHFHDRVTRAVITCPAVFDEVEKDQLREAARRAGFLDVALLEEPVAAADAYTKNGIKVGRDVLVYDLGGGTFDLAAREEGEDEFRLAMEPRGKRIGGEDFDRAIYDYFEAEVRKKSERPICPDGLDLDLLRRCRRLKESLSVTEQTAPLFWRGNGMKLTLRLSRSSFEDLVENHVEVTVRLTQSIKADAAAAGFPLESVILIGGASRTPCIIRRLQETLQAEPRKWEKQDVAVALGAAYHAQRLWGEGSRSQHGRTQPENGGAARTQQSHQQDRQRPRSENGEAASKQRSQHEGEDSKEQEKAKDGATHGSGERKPCPMCAEMIMVTAAKCRFCGEIFDDALHRSPVRSVTGRVIVKGQWYGFLMPFTILLDNVVLGHARVGSGCDFAFETIPGEHLLEVDAGFSFEKVPRKSYPLIFPEGGHFRITLTSGIRAGQYVAFANPPEVQKMPGRG